MQLKPASKDDYEGLKTFMKMMILDTFEKNGIAHLKKDLEEEIADKMVFLEKYYELIEEDSKPFLCILKKSDDIIGTVSLARANALIVRATKGLLKDTLEIGNFFIHPSVQGQGFGTRLLKETLLWLKNNDVKEFCLDTGYPKAQIFWQKHLGKPVYDFKDYWEPGSRYMIWLVKDLKTVKDEKR